MPEELCDRSGAEMRNVHVSMMFLDRLICETGKKRKIWENQYSSARALLRALELDEQDTTYSVNGPQRKLRKRNL